MKASSRPPPARPHAALNVSSSFSGYGFDWGEDDAWDSASDSESAIAPSRSTAVAVPKRPNANNSSSALSLSYTHISAPSPSSYTPSGESLGVLSKEAESKAGWTIVTRSSENRSKDSPLPIKNSSKIIGSSTKIDAKDIDEEIDMVVGDLEQEPRLVAHPVNIVKSTAEEIVKGSSLSCVNK